MTNFRSIDFCQEALDTLSKFTFTEEFVENNAMIRFANGHAYIKFPIDNFAFHIDYDLNRSQSYEPDRYFWSKQIKVKLDIGVSEATGDDLIVDYCTLNSDTDRIKLWNKYNKLLENILLQIGEFKKKINHRILTDLRSTNIIKAVNMPKDARGQFEIAIRIGTVDIYKLDDAELALVLLMTE